MKIPATSASTPAKIPMPSPGERKDSHGDQINREQKHADVFGNHAVSMSKCADG
jgi:hypothetical protein